MNETHKKQIGIHSIIILVGILVIIVFGDETSWLRYFNILAILIILRSLIWFISNSEELLFYIFPTKTIREKKPKLKLKDNEKKVLEAIRILFNSIDEIEIFNKKAVYLYLREITGLNTKQVVNNLNKLRVKYRSFKSDWNRGKI